MDVKNAPIHVTFGQNTEVCYWCTDSEHVHCTDMDSVQHQALVLSDSFLLCTFYL